MTHVILLCLVRYWTLRQLTCLQRLHTSREAISQTIQFAFNVPKGLNKVLNSCQAVQPRFPAIEGCCQNSLLRLHLSQKQLQLRGC